MKTKPMTMLLMMIAGWMNREQQEIIEYLQAENGILVRNFKRPQAGNASYLMTNSADVWQYLLRRLVV